MWGGGLSFMREGRRNVCVGVFFNVWVFLQ